MIWCSLCWWPKAPSSASSPLASYRASSIEWQKEHAFHNCTLRMLPSTTMTCELGTELELGLYDMDKENHKQSISSFSKKISGPCVNIRGELTKNLTKVWFDWPLEITRFSSLSHHRSLGRPALTLTSPSLPFAFGLRFWIESRHHAIRSEKLLKVFLLFKWSIVKTSSSF